jgi:hypothetical protein
MGSITAADSERGCSLGRAGGGHGRALKGQDVAVGDVEMHGGGRMTRAGAGRPRSTAVEPRWTGERGSGSRFDAGSLRVVSVRVAALGARETGSQV